MFLKIFVFIAFFLLLGGFLIISNENLSLNNAKNIEKFIYEYQYWLNNQVLNNSVKTLGYVINNNFVKK
ncbi:MAG: hypothetical protein WC402_03390 [Candidatus Pacearchaeota archaeon]|jgi:hypothetical protein